MEQDDNRTYNCLDMALVDDEALVVLAKECDYSPARDEILLRYSTQTERLIQWLARSTEFGSTDIEDARQNAVFWTVEAINKFDTDQIGRERRCSFYSFLYRVLVARFKDFSKQVRRLERRRRLASDNTDENQSLSHIFRDPTDPALVVEAEEAARWLQSAVAELDDECRQIWQRLCEGINLREIATEMGLSYDSAKRRRRKLIQKLKFHLRQSPLTGSAIVNFPSPEAAD